MNKDFHFFATYTAARLAGFTIDEAYVIGAASQFTDMCTKTFLDAIGGPVSAATTQVNAELIKVRMDVVGDSIVLFDAESKKNVGVGKLEFA